MTIRKKNKFVALLLALLLAVGMLPVTAHAAGPMTLEVGSVTAELKAGETVEVPITATANSGYVAGVLDVSWDKTALELTDVTYSPTLAPKGNSAPIPTNNPGKYTIDFGNNIATENYTGTGEFFKLVFKITDTAAAGDHAISLSGFQIYDFDINELPVTSNPGKVTLTAASVKPTITTTSLPEGTVGASYSATLNATGTTPITWSVSSGTLPAGLSLSGNTISGTPTTAGTANITVKAVNVAGEATKNLSIKINAASVKPTITTTTLPNGRVDSAYSFTLKASGTGTITWSYTGTMPAGLDMDSNGKITGTPTTEETKTITVKAKNSEGEVTKDFTITILPKSSGGGGGGGYVSTYAITVEDAKNGDVTVSHKSTYKGATVTVTVDPDKGYSLETLTVTDKNGKEIELTNKGDGKYTFKMPASKVTVKATFMDDNTMLNYFVDVFATDYYYDAVLWAVQEGITNGTSPTTFSPGEACTRSQMATFLWRAAGAPDPVGVSNPFADVDADAYYAKAVQWAYEQGITGGTSATTFSPDEACTRGQMATFLCRMADGKPVNDTVIFADIKADKYYAKAVQWAYEQKITAGTSATTFSPDDPCTRAQMVTFLYRFFVK